MKVRGRPEGRTITQLRHGGLAVVPVTADEGVDRGGVTRPQAEALARSDTSITVVEDDAGAGAPAEPFDEITTPFDYAFDDLLDDAYGGGSRLPADPAVVAALGQLADAMVEQDPPDGAHDSRIPPVYTYWGQFIDHDLTANTDRDGAVSDIKAEDLGVLDPDQVRAALGNLRYPALNLDNLYPHPPTHQAELEVPRDGAKLRVGQNAPVGSGAPGVLIPPDDDLARDLPRIATDEDGAGTALIGDARNDENLIVAQLQTGFLRFHNAVVDWVLANEPSVAGDDAVFERARQLVQWTYQWLVVHDYLPTVTKPGVVDATLAHPDERFAPRENGVFMPLEFSTAAFRFGHSMVRASYDYNRNFGRGDGNAPLIPTAPFNLIFAFTGGGGALADTADTLPFNWIIEWDRFVDRAAAFPDRFARKIDTFLALPLSRMVKEGFTQDPQNPVPPDVADRLNALLKHLARRNLLRGYHLAVPTGQAVAAALGVDALDKDDLAGVGTPLRDALEQAGGILLEKTPLWYYVLREAEVREDGESLGEVGSIIVCQTIIGQIRNDPDSYLNQSPSGWAPERGVTFADGSPVRSIGDLLRFAGVMA